MKLPTIDACINWAKENNFKLIQGTCGNRSCGCALTLLYFMHNEGPPNNIYRWAGDNLPSGIITGFDSLGLQNVCLNVPYMDRGLNFGASLYEAAVQHGLLVVP